jgi:hypothetical protein
VGVAVLDQARVQEADRGVDRGVDQVLAQEADREVAAVQDRALVVDLVVETDREVDRVLAAEMARAVVLGLAVGAVRERAAKRCTRVNSFGRGPPGNRSPAIPNACLLGRALFR